MSPCVALDSFAWKRSHQQPGDSQQKLTLSEPLEMDDSDDNLVTSANRPQDYNAMPALLLLDKSESLLLMDATATTKSQTMSLESCCPPARRNNPAQCDKYHHHLVLPSDTLAGLCVTYKVTKQALRRANPGCCLSYDGIRLAVPPGDVIIIPAGQCGIATPQDESSREYKIASVLAACRHVTTTQAKSYLKGNHWQVDLAIQQARNELHQQQKEEERLQQEERQRKKDALEIQRILLKQHQRNGSLYSHSEDGTTDTELTRLTAGGNNNNTSTHGSHDDDHGDESFLYVDQPHENEAKENFDSACLTGCCTFIGVFIFEWIRLSIHIV